jgi:5-formyltetrahydrofolate cyclo-ligase
MTNLLVSPSLRLHLRKARRALSSSARRQNNLRITHILSRLLLVQRSRRVAVYLSEDGEVDLMLLQGWLTEKNRLMALPVLRNGPVRRLWFCEFQPTARLRPNRFGIDEPDSRRYPPISLRNLDIVLMPLVGFDDQLHRMGMGGGYYDRTFGVLREKWRWRRPKLIGVAYECQRVDELDQQPWDVPMDLVVTELGIYRGGGASVERSGNPHKKGFA